ncbi:MAG: hypothetical protein ACKOD8_06795, partial [Limnohabitans sp.]
MRCTHCNAESSLGKSFCADCGTPLGGNPKSSPTPTAPLVDQVPVSNAHANDALSGERKVITVLFADIKGSMALIENLDPEEARSLVEPALQLMIDAVLHY